MLKWFLAPLIPLFFFFLARYVVRFMDSTDGDPVNQDDDDDSNNGWPCLAESAGSGYPDWE